jgi:hypothetical protein
LSGTNRLAVSKHWTDRRRSAEIILVSEAADYSSLSVAWD